MDKQQWIELLKTDVKEFNLKREECGYGYLDLSSADLYCTDLIGADLIGANLEGANLKGANLEGAYLIGAKLTAEQIAMLPKLLGIVEDE